jgi:hypothetical protein
MLRRNNINNNNTTFILEDMRTIMRDQQRDISSIKNTSSAQEPYNSRFHKLSVLS